MAIEKKLIHFGKLADFETQLTAGNILDRSIVFIQDAKKIWTHGTYYDCSESVSPDADNVYITDFTVNDLENAIGSGSDVVADLTSLEEALAAHKVVLVPYDAGEGFLGYGILVGYAEDFLYLSIYSGGYDSVFYEIEASRGHSTIRTILKRTWFDKQDRLVSGTNIKTINGSPILGEGDLALATKMAFGDLTDVVYAQAIEGGGCVYALPDQANGDEDDILLSRQTVKTINGESIVGSGDIVIEGGETLTESDIAAMGFTKNIGTITGFAINGTTTGVSGGTAYLPNASTSAYGVTKLSSATNSTSTALAATSSAVKAAYDLANSKQATLVSGTNIKTINGTSLLGSGNITIEGGSGGGSSAYSEVSHGTSDTTFTLTPNVFHVWDEVASLTLTLGDETAGVANEFLFQFNSGSTATTLTLPDTIKWANDSAPTIEANKIYQVSILKGLASVLEFDNEVIITFSISGTEYQTEKGMTWEEWCSSEYNTDGWVIYNNQVRSSTSLYSYYYINGVTSTDIIISQNYIKQLFSGGGSGD